MSATRGWVTTSRPTRVTRSTSTRSSTSTSSASRSPSSLLSGSLCRLWPRLVSTHPLICWAVKISLKSWTTHGSKRSAHQPQSNASFFVQKGYILWLELKMRLTQSLKMLMLSLQQTNKGWWCVDDNWACLPESALRGSGFTESSGLSAGMTIKYAFQRYLWKVHCSRDRGTSGASHCQCSLFTKGILAPLTPWLNISAQQ